MRPGPKATLGDLETAALAQQDIRGRYPHVLELDLGVAVRRVVIAEHRQGPEYFDARGVHGHQDHRLLAVLVGRRIGLAHEDEDLAARIGGARSPPLAAVDDIFVTVAHDAGFDVGGVRRRHHGLRHGEGRADLTVQQRLQPFLFVLGLAEPRANRHELKLPSIRPSQQTRRAPFGLHFGDRRDVDPVCGNEYGLCRLYWFGDNDVKAGKSTSIFCFYRVAHKYPNIQGYPLIALPFMVIAMMMSALVAGEVEIVAKSLRNRLPWCDGELLHRGGLTSKQGPPSRHPRRIPQQLDLND